MPQESDEKQSLTNEKQHTPYGHGLEVKDAEDTNRKSHTSTGWCNMRALAVVSLLLLGVVGLFLVLGYRGSNSSSSISHASGVDSSLATAGEKGKDGKDNVAFDADVCIVGGGAFGSAFAVFANDNGYDVLVFDADPQLGGHCDTETVLDFPSGFPPNSHLWIDIGAKVFSDTRIPGVNVINGVPTFAIDMRQYMERFAGAGSAINIGPIKFPDASYPFYQYKNQANPDIIIELPASAALSGLPTACLQQCANGPNAACTGCLTSFQTALATFKAKLSQYPFLDKGKASPVPAELLIPFTQWVELNNFGILYNDIFLPQLVFGGVTQLSKMAAYHALVFMGPTLNQLYEDFNPATTEKGGFIIENGCQTVYDGIQEVLGADKLVLNSRIREIKRGKDGISITDRGNTYTCKYLVMAFPQVVEQMSFLDLKAREVEIFGSVHVDGYMTGLVTMSNDPQSFALGYQNTSNPPPFLVNSPGLFGINKNLGPAANLPIDAIEVYGYSDRFPYTNAEKQVYIDNAKAQLQALVNKPVYNGTGFDGVLATAVDLANIDIDFHEYVGRPDVSELTNYYINIDNLQGYKNTFWGGAATNYNAHHVLINDAFLLVQRFFKKK
eukprot:gb/GEZN01003138.1/.p1 GENE.gb/GEZN01003138.1/~~gb/GEZN01003138.1/.p1  ORF type:complete len:624 (+),score=87.50 gb/GEZN01003138.1/:36-1874(+)